VLIEIQDGYITCRWSDFYTNYKSQGNGHARVMDQGAYMNSKHKVREKANSVGYYYMGEVSVSVLMNIGIWPRHGQGGCPDAH